MTARLALVADDDAVTSTLIEQNLASIGLDVIRAHDGAEAMALFDRHEQIRVILCDLHMPGLDGLEVCRQVRAREPQQHTPFVLFTAEEGADYQVALDAGVDDFLCKPLRRNELLLRVQSLLRIFDVQQNAAEGFALLSRQHALMREVQEEFGRVRDLIVHDMKNPLASLLANTRYLLPRAAGEDRETMLDVVYASENLHRIVENMTDITRAWDRPLRVARALVDVNALLSKWLKDNEAFVTLNGRHLELQLGSEIGKASVDASLLRRVLDNLLDNASRYAPNGSTITVDAKEDAAALTVRVTDQGMTMTPAAQSEMFDLKAVMRERPAQPGRRAHGLGLAFCRMAVEAHGGKVWIEAQATANAFCFSLPKE